VALGKIWYSPHPSRTRSIFDQSLTILDPTCVSVQEFNAAWRIAAHCNIDSQSIRSFPAGRVTHSRLHDIEVGPRTIAATQYPRHHVAIEDKDKAVQVLAHPPARIFSLFVLICIPMHSLTFTLVPRAHPHPGRHSHLYPHSDTFSRAVPSRHPYPLPLPQPLTSRHHPQARPLSGPPTHHPIAPPSLVLP
jgi:hypothetical protein